MSIKLSNVLGVPFRPFVRDQLKARVRHGITGGQITDGADILRSADDVSYLGNQLAWVKLASSVTVSTEYLTLLKEQFAEYGDGDAFLDNWTSRGLAQNWILQAGTSKQNIDAAGNIKSGVELRAGIGDDGAYGLGGSRTQGYRPMPGISSVQIKSAGRLGSLRYATIDFKVWNRNQLDVMDALYLRLGYTMLLEWGHVQYFEKESSQTLTTATSGIDIFFNKEITKEELQYEINKKIGESRGNYDAMLGVVCNFDCSFNQEGGWDCSVKLIGLGSIMESQKINLSYTMPPSIKKVWEKIEGAIERARKDEILKETAKKNQEAKDDAKKAYDDRTAKYNKDNPIQDITTFAANKFGAGENDQLNGIFAAVRPLLDYSQENNIVEGSNNDLDNEIVIRIAPPVASLSSVAADYYKDGVLYLAHLGEVGYVNPLTLNKSIIVTSPNKLNEIGQKLATDNGRRYQPEVIVEAGKTRGVLDNIITLGGLIPQVIEAVKISINGDVPLTRFTEQGQEFFTTLLGLELRRRCYLDIVGDRDVAIEKFIGFTGYESNGFSYKQNMRISNTATGVILPAQPVTQRLSAALAGVYDQNGNIISEKYKFLSGVATSNFIASVLTAVSGYNTNYRMKVTGLEDGKYGEKYTTTYIATQEDLIKIIPAAGTTEFQFQTPAGSILKYPELQIKLRIESSIPSLIEDIKNENVTQKEGPFSAPPESEPDFAKVNISMENMSLGLGSALEAMLTIVKYDAISKSEGISKVKSYDITSITAKFLTDGTGSLPPMAPLFNKNGLNVGTGDPDKIDYYPFLKPIKESSDKSLVLKDPTSLGVKGYCTALMQDYNLDPDPENIKTELQRWEEIPSVDFQKLFKSYIIPKYILNSAQDAPKFKNEYPVYISLGYLLFFLNNQSLLYDTTKKSSVSVGSNNIARPIFYIDYNPKTNLCGTLPSQLTIDPDICMIPYSRDTAAYKKLFIFGIEPDEVLFTTGDATDRVSSAIEGYKTADNAYQATTMNILLNVDYLLNLIKSTIDRDKHNNVYLQSFLEQILADVNRSMGDINAFRVAYNDNANTVVINDDQYVPPLTGEKSIFEIGKELTGNNKNLFELPVFENISLATNFTLQTDTSTRMSRAIAIGAQVQNSGAAQSVDASSYHWLNNGFTDRIIEVKQNATTPKKVTDPKDKKEDPNLILATKFNTHIKNIYSEGGNIYREGTDPARNFLIQSATKVKAEDEQAYASLTIPYNATLSLMGISGIMMGNAFLLPDKILPISIRGTNSKIKYGFYVMGLEHTLDTNMWATNIKGQIVRIRANRSPAAALAQSSDTFIGGTTTSPQPAGGIGTNFVASTTGIAAAARAAVVAYYGGSITDQEWNELVALVFAEAGNTREQRAYITAIILNRARQEGRSISNSIRIENAYQPVTGRVGARGSEQSFIDGPTREREIDIYQTLSTSLTNIPKGYNAFTALNPNAYKNAEGVLSKKGLEYREQLLTAEKEGKGVILYNNNNRASINGTIAAQL